MTYEALPVVDQGAVGHALEVLKREAFDVLQQPLMLAQLHLYTSAYVSIRQHTSADVLQQPLMLAQLHLY